MMLLPNLKMRLLHVALWAALIGAGILIVPAAQAFTFENQNAGGGNTSNFSGADSRFSTNTNSNGSSPARRGFSGGNSSIQFGGQSSFNQRYNADRMFEPNSLMGNER